MIYGIAGGYFAWYAFVHVLSDWIPQSHFEAINKSTNFRIRTKHCAIYALLFLPVLLMFGMCWWKILASLAILFVSHHAIDTYYSTVMWMKYIRKAPAFAAMTDMKFRWRIDEADIRAFRTTIQEPVGAILMIAIDQFTHLLFLIPIVWMTVR
jgi:hypothetical protein